MIVTFALVSGLSTIAVATTSYLLVRRVTLNSATQDAVRQGRSSLEDAADRLPLSPSRTQVHDLVVRLRARGGFDVVAVEEAHSDGLDDHGRRAARLLVVESRRLAALVEDLMEISRLDAKVAPLEWEPVELAAVAAGALDLRGWRHRVELHAEGEAATWGDRRRLDAIVGNMVGNAFAHGRMPVRVEVGAGDDEVTVAVRDSGPGIAPEHAAHLFERFYKADPARSRSSGSGLGLAIARENARLHGGEVSITSPPERGTTFTLTLPVRSAPPEPARRPPGNRCRTVTDQRRSGDHRTLTAIKGSRRSRR